MASVKFFLCTRNRAVIVKRHLISIDNAIRCSNLSGSFDYFIIDDSDDMSEKDKMNKINSEYVFGNINIHIVDSVEQVWIIEAVGNIKLEYNQFIENHIKILGTGLWDLAGARNFAFLYAYIVSDEADVLVFLDDDMIFDDIIYEDQEFVVDGGYIIDELIASITPRELCAAGSGYWGRKDVSIVQHLSRIYSRIDVMNIDDMLVLEIAKGFGFPQVLPINIDTERNTLNGSSGEGPGGISGAVLATTPQSLKSHFLLRSYNEDWIWLLLLGNSSKSIKRISRNVVHAAPPQKPITIEFLRYQEIGETIYGVLLEIMKICPEETYRIDFCKNKLNENLVTNAIDLRVKDIDLCIDKVDKIIDHLNSSYGDVDIDKLKVTIYYLEYVREEIARINPSEMLSEITQYMNDFFIWEEMLVDAKSSLNGLI